MAKATDSKQYRVLQSVNRWNDGDLITESDVEAGEVDRLIELEVIRPATDDDLKLAETVKLKEAAARKAARDAQRTPEQVEADAKAATETGHPLQGASEG